MIRDGIIAQGCFRLKIYKSDELIEEYEDNNLVVDVGKHLVCQLLGGGSTDAITQVQAGTNGTATTQGDTTITNPYTKAISTVSYPQLNQVQYDWILTAGEANGMAITEFGLVTSGGVLFARKVRTAINKVSPMVIVGSWLITVN